MCACVVQLNSDRIGSTFQPPRTAEGSPTGLETDGPVSVADGGDAIIDPEDEWAGLLGIVSPSPLSPLSPRAPIPPDGYPLSHDFSDDSVEAEVPSWSPETLQISGGGISTTPSPTDFGARPGSGQRSARSCGSGSSSAEQGGREEDEGAARAAEARAAATAMFSQLPGTTRPQDNDSGCVPTHHCRAVFFNLMALTFYGHAFVSRTGSARALRLPQNLARG